MRASRQERGGEDVSFYLLQKLQDERDEAIALARRVYAECGPCDEDGTETVGKWTACKSCKAYNHRGARIPHPESCLWLAAEALLAKATTTPTPRSQDDE